MLKLLVEDHTLSSMALDYHFPLISRAASWWSDGSEEENWELGLFLLRCFLLCLNWARLPKSTFLYGLGTDLKSTKCGSIQFNSIQFNSIPCHTLKSLFASWFYPSIWRPYQSSHPLTHFCPSNINSPTNISTGEIIKVLPLYFFLTYALPLWVESSSHPPKPNGYLPVFPDRSGDSDLFCVC